MFLGEVLFEQRERDRVPAPGQQRDDVVPTDRGRATLRAGRGAPPRAGRTAGSEAVLVSRANSRCRYIADWNPEPSPSRLCGKRLKSAGVIHRSPRQAALSPPVQPGPAQWYQGTPDVVVGQRLLGLPQFEPDQSEASSIT